MDKCGSEDVYAFCVSEENNIFKMKQGQVNMGIFVLLIIVLLAYKFNLEQNESLLLQSSKQEAIYKNSLVRNFITNFTNCSDLGVDCELLDVCNKSIWTGLQAGPKRRWSRSLTARLLNATTANIIDFKRVPLIKGLKNPCFGIENGAVVDNISAVYAIFNKLDVYCLPYFFLIGFPKSSTSFFHGILTQHQKIQRTYCFEDYPCPASNNSKNNSVEIKEPNWWDNTQTQAGKTFRKYTGLFSTAKDAIVKDFLQTYAQKKCDLAKCDINEEIITGDFSPYTAWSPETWKDEEINQGSPEPVVLSPHKIQTILPNSKLIVLMRNPTDRLYSEYNSRIWTHTNQSSSDFHFQCKKAIKWWLACTEILGLSERHCAFGSYYPRVLKNVKSIINAGTEISKPIGIEEPLEGQVPVIENNQISIRLRIGLYVIYIKEWLSLFPRSSFLFLKYKTFMSDPLGTLQDKVYPFLDLPFVKKPTSPKQTSASRYAPMLPETREMLDEFYQPYNIQLSALIEDDDFLWKQ